MNIHLQAALFLAIGVLSLTQLCICGEQQPKRESQPLGLVKSKREESFPTR